MKISETLGRRFARVATNQVVKHPGLWKLFRGPMRSMFDQIAPVWDVDRSPEAFASLEEALARVSSARRALDLGTGTGEAAFRVANRFPDAEVVGADLSPAMIVEARRKTPPELEDRVRFDEVDAERLPYADEWFDLVTLANMIPFFDELDRVVAPGGWVVFAWSAGPQTPIYVPPEVLSRELGARGYSDFAEIAAGNGTAFVARKASAE
ncbi:MAG: class I SAM-dependent methyltransferase [Gaiellaceae bacterium]